MTTTVVLAEDSYLMREGLASLLETLDDVDLVAVCETYDQLIEAVDEHRPAVVITDIRMPPSQTDEGIRAANHIREHYPDTGVVVLSQYSEPGYALRLFRDGASGRAYLLKDRVGDIGHQRQEDGGQENDKPRVQQWAFLDNHRASRAKAPGKAQRRDEDAEGGEHADPTPTGRRQPPVGEQEQAEGQQRKEGQNRGRLGDHQDPRGRCGEISWNHRFHRGQDQARIVDQQHRASGTVWAIAAIAWGVGYVALAVRRAQHSSGRPADVSARLVGTGATNP